MKSVFGKLNHLLHRNKDGASSPTSTRTSPTVSSPISSPLTKPQESTYSVPTYDLQTSTYDYNAYQQVMRGVILHVKMDCMMSCSTIFVASHVMSCHVM